MDLSKYKRFADLTRQKKELNAELAPIKSELEQLAKDLPAGLLEEGLDRMTLNGYTMYLKRNVYVKAKEGITSREISDALFEHGFDDVAKPGTVALKSLYNSYAGEDEEVPEWLSNLVQTSTETKLTANVATKKTK